MAVAEEGEWVAAAVVAVAKRISFLWDPPWRTSPWTTETCELDSFFFFQRRYEAILRLMVEFIRSFMRPLVDRLNHLGWEDQGQPEITSGGDDTTKSTMSALHKIEAHLPDLYLSDNRDSPHSHRVLHTKTPLPPSNRSRGQALGFRCGVLDRIKSLC